VKDQATNNVEEHGIYPQLDTMDPHNHNIAAEGNNWRFDVTGISFMLPLIEALAFFMRA
jgi:hypothetical protein